MRRLAVQARDPTPELYDISAPDRATVVSQLLTDVSASPDRLGVSPYLRFTRSDWASLRESTPLTLTAADLVGAGLADALDRRNLLCVDMGGTSFDLSLIVNGQPNVSTETELEGLPVLMPLVDIHTIGAGGGSLAWLEAGALRVGPQSAGADPGPVCYGHGGTAPTVTDANLFLNRLDPAYFLGGRMQLDVEGARRAIHEVASQVGLDDVALAEGMLAIINAKMADAMARSRSSRVSILAISPWSRSVAPGPCTPSGWLASWRSRRSSSRGAPEPFRPGGCCRPISVMT